MISDRSIIGVLEGEVDEEAVVTAIAEELLKQGFAVSVSDETVDDIDDIKIVSEKYGQPSFSIMGEKEFGGEEVHVRYFDGLARTNYSGQEYSAYQIMVKTSSMLDKSLSTFEEVAELFRSLSFRIDPLISHFSHRQTHVGTPERFKTDGPALCPLSYMSEDLCDFSTDEIASSSEIYQVDDNDGAYYIRPTEQYQPVKNDQIRNIEEVVGLEYEV